MKDQKKTANFRSTRKLRDGKSDLVNYMSGRTPDLIGSGIYKTKRLTVTCLTGTTDIETPTLKRVSRYEPRSERWCLLL